MTSRRIRWIFVAALLPVAVAAPAFAQVDFSGLDRFWDVVLILEQDADPEDGLWGRLFATPGYAVLTKSEFSREFFIRLFSLAFKPSLREEREEFLRSEKAWAVAHLEHIQRAGEMRTPIMEFRRSFDADSLIGRAVHIAAAWLPPSVIEGPPPVSFVVFGPDARGYIPVVIDVLLGMNLGDRLVELLAHEFHHYYRNRILVYDREAVQDEDEDIVWVFDQFQAEGMANLVTYRNLLEDDDPAGGLPEDFKKWFEKSPEILRMLNDLLERAAESPEKQVELGQELKRAVPRSGHPTGFFMALTILDVLGRDALIQATGDPLAFVLLYQKAASRKENEMTRFSQKALDVVTRVFDR